jgi:hypothetical protein
MLKIQKLLTALLLAVLITILVWAFLHGQTKYSQPPITPTIDSNTNFKLNIPQKALWRNYLVVSAKVDDGTSCRLIYIPPSGNKKAMDVTADSDGLCKWQWKIEETDGKGSGRLIFTIDGASETHFIEIRSSF